MNVMVICSAPKWLFGLRCPTQIKHLCVWVILFIAHNTASAALIETYLQATTRSRECVEICNGGNSEIAIATIINTDYGEDGLAQILLAPGGAGTETAASAGFGGNAFAPTLSVYANTTHSMFSHTTSAFGLQRYEFTAAGTVTINGTLTYSQSGVSVPFDNGAPLGHILGSFFTFQMVNDMFDMDDCIVTNQQIVFGKTPRHCAVFGSRPLNEVGVTMPTQMNFQRTDFNTGSDAAIEAVQMLALSFSGNAGDVFFLGSELVADARLGGFSESLNTLRINFDNPSIVRAAFARDTFVPAPLSVPEPSTMLLLLISIAGVFFHRHRFCS